MIHYRKHNSGRQFFKVESDDRMIKVIIQESIASVGLFYNKVIIEDVTADKEMYLPSTEEEFNRAKSEAEAFINLKNINKQ